MPFSFLSSFQVTEIHLIDWYDGVVTALVSILGHQHWCLASLPRYIDSTDIERLISTCDSNNTAGSRDRAIILLLARLGLRAGDVRDLRLSDIDWSSGCVRVVGKGRSENHLPLPQEVGDAISASKISKSHRTP